MFRKTVASVAKKPGFFSPTSNTASAGSPIGSRSLSVTSEDNDFLNQSFHTDLTSTRRIVPADQAELNRKKDKMSSTADYEQFDPAQHDRKMEEFFDLKRFGLGYR